MIAAILAASGLSAGLSGEACAQTGGRSIGDTLMGRVSPSSPSSPATPPVARYVSEQGPSFILDRSTATPLLRFENSAEVWVLQPVPSSRGDIVYYNDLGQMVLRATRIGGLTLYTEAKPQGLAASFSGAARAIEPFLAVNNAVAQQRLAQANTRMADAAHRPIKLDVQAVGAPIILAMAVDTATLIAEAFEVTASQPGGAQVLAGLHTVMVRTAKSGITTVVRHDGVLSVTLRPDQGPAGRPSSRRMIVTLNGR